jgi:hypothetical protein
MVLPCALQALQAFPDEVARLRVEPGGGFVEQQQFGVVDQRAGQRQTPLHAAGEGADVGVRLAGEAGEFQQTGDLRGRISASRMPK